MPAYIFGDRKTVVMIDAPISGILCSCYPWIIKVCYNSYAQLNNLWGWLDSTPAVIVRERKLNW